MDVITYACIFPTFTTGLADCGQLQMPEYGLRWLVRGRWIKVVWINYNISVKINIISNRNLNLKGFLRILADLICHLAWKEFVCPTCYRKISQSLEATRLTVLMIVSFWNLTGISSALLPRYLKISEQLGESKPESRGFETSRYLTVRGPSD